MKKYTINKQKAGNRRSYEVSTTSYDNKQEAVNDLHEYCYAIADRLDAIYTTPDDNSVVRLTAGNGAVYSDILANPTIEDDRINIDVYTYTVEESEHD